MGNNQNKKKQKRGGASLNFTTIVNLTMALFLVGLIALLIFMGANISKHVKESITFSVVLKDQTNEQQINRIKKELDASEYVKSATYITKDEALKELKESLGEDMSYLDYNPLLASINVRLNSEYANEETIKLIINKFKQYDQIKEVIYQKELLHAINKNLTTIGLILGGLAAILVAISIILILNTIHTNVHSHRYSIRTMQLVGATSNHIRRPFIWKNIRMGMVASVIALLALSALLYFVREQLSSILAVSDIDKVVIVYIFVFAVGCIIPFLCAWGAVNKYLNKKEKDLRQ